jgi:nicotinamide mononucleotide adenylyltransferase
LAAAEKCDLLWVGITQPTIQVLRGAEGQPPHRHRTADNPLTYWERATVISAALSAEGVGPDRVRIVPFPIEEPPLLPEYIPISVPAYTTIYDDWNRRKVEVLLSLGYEVVVLWEGKPKTYSGGEVRRLLREGNNDWRALVPTAAQDALDALGIPDRLRQVR